MLLPILYGSELGLGPKLALGSSKASALPAHQENINFKEFPPFLGRAVQQGAA
jgi:hypothetical protein